MELMTTPNALNHIFGSLWGYLLLILISTNVRALCTSCSHLQTSQLAMKMTAGLLDVLYNKMTRLSETTKNTNAQGSLANILFTDTFKLQIFVRLSFLIMVVVLDLIVAVVFLGVYINPVSIIGAATILIFIPLVALFAVIMQKYIKRLAPLRDQRS